jgi:hydrogenase maturation protease
VNGTRTLFVGLGSPHGDDQVGWRVAEELRHRQPDRAVRVARTPAELLDWLEGLDGLELCDAVRGATPGRLHVWDWPTPQLGRLRSAGSHAFGVTAVLELAQRLGRLPATVRIWGIEARQFEPTQSIADELAAQLAGVVDRIQ